MSVNLGFLFVICVVIATASSCTTDAECPQDQCCAHARLDLLGLTQVCKPYGGEGDACHGSFLSSSCDCHEGLICVEHTGLFDSLLNSNTGECRENGTDTSPPVGLLSSLFG